jgi:hypothetical protein
MKNKNILTQQAPGTYYTHRTDMKTLKHFEQNDYIGALTYLGVLPEDEE